MNLLAAGIEKVGQKFGIPEMGVSERFGSPKAPSQPSTWENASGGLGGLFDGLKGIEIPGVPGGTSAPVGGGGGAALPKLNQAAVDNTQLAINEIPGLLEAALNAERQNYRNTVAGFDAGENQQRETYGKSTETNQLNYDANFMDSIRSGIRGLGSLVSLLRGSGATGGTAEEMVRDTVGGITSNDIRTGADTQKENQAALDTSLSGYLTELKNKRQLANDTLANNEGAIRRDSNTQLQDLFGKMAGFFGDAGKTAEAGDFMARAGALTPEIARSSRTQVSGYDTTPVAIQAPQLNAFTAPTQPEVATAPVDGKVGSGIFTMNRRRTEEQPAIAPLGA